MLSVVIPVLNEAAGIGICLAFLQTWGDRLEIIVVDGGSEDQTLEVVRQFSQVKVLQSPAGRGWQMNEGAAIATRETLLFLHGDTQLPATFLADIEQTLQRDQVIAGAFPLRIADDNPQLRWIERLVQWRSQFFSLPYGDQCIFLKTKDFRQFGGYRPLPIMEDYELMQRLKQYGKIALAEHPVTTSSRRWQKLGIWRTTWINQLMILGYHLRIDPDKLRTWYRHQATMQPSKLPTNHD
ncbi:MAG: TIGR04283 family arsenosugar biosynthesis glycosyltransferase [Limnothrix sp.]